MKHIGNEVYVTKEELESEMVNYLMEDDDLKKDAMLSLMVGAIMFSFIKFVFKEGKKNEIMFRS